MSILKLNRTMNKQEFDVVGGSFLGEISNATGFGQFGYKPSECDGYLSAKELRDMADTLDELNQKEGGAE